jgi:hypothetical protein
MRDPRDPVGDFDQQARHIRIGAAGTAGGRSGDLDGVVAVLHLAARGLLFRAPRLPRA